MTRRTFYALANEAPTDIEPVAVADNAHTIRHGYNLADLDRLSRIAVARCVTRAGSAADRYQTAWSAIAERLVTAQDRPEPDDLIAAGWRAIADYGRNEAREHGHNYENVDSPQFDRYWAPRHIPGPEKTVVERNAMWAILPLMSPRQREAVQALAATEDHRLAAQSMGLSDKAYRVQLSAARRRFLAWWHQHETPRRVPTDRRVYSRSGTCRGKPLMTVSQVEEARARYHAGETLAVIAADYGYKKAGLSALLTGRSRPAPDPVET